MLTADIIRFSLKSLKGYQSRTLLMLLAISISVASVILLTALGEGARRYVNGEFASLGTNLVIVMPGKSETSGGGLDSMMGNTTRDLTLEDAESLRRHPSILRVSPLNIGAAEISWKNRKREILVMGASSELLQIRHWSLASGQFLADTDWNRATPVCVIGSKIRDELFGAQAALGQWVRLGQNRYRVIGVLASEGRSIGIDVQETVVIPVASAQSLFNTSSLYRIFVEAKNRDSIPSVIEFVSSQIKQRHFGEEDVTVITQDSVLETFDSILRALTMGVGGIAAISLIVSGILIMNVMLVAVSQRTSEIGLLKALGSSRKQILTLILTEALLLALMGTLLGFLTGIIGAWAIRSGFPDIQAYPPVWAWFSSFFVALVTSLIFSSLPARKAAQLDPVIALQRS